MKLNSAKWFNSNIANLLENYNKDTLVNFKPDKNIKTEIYKTKPKYNITFESSIYGQQAKQINTIFNSWDNQKDLSNTLKKFTKLGSVIRVERYKLNLSTEQENIIQTWIKECKRVYNYCVNKHNNDNTFFNKGYKSVKKTLFDEIYGENEKPIPYDVLTDEVRAFDSNLKSCRSNLKNKHITHFTLKPKSFKNGNYSLLIPHKSIYKNGIFKTYIGDIKDLNIDVSNHDSRLYYNAYEQSFSLNIPVDKKCKELHNRESVCAIDPGEKNFISFYGSSSYGSIGTDIRKPLLKIRNKISRYQKILSKNINRNGKSIKNKKSLKNKIKNLYKKSKNIVKELHNQSANYLCKNYDTILIPKFETQKMIKTKKKFKEYKQEFINQGSTLEERKENAKIFTKKCRLNKSVKYVLNNLSHYTFRQHLLDKSKEYGCQCSVVTEEYTSCTCSFCGYISNNYVNRVKTCSYCNRTIDRDLNGAKNILIKNSKILSYKANGVLLTIRK